MILDWKTSQWTNHEGGRSSTHRVYLLDVSISICLGKVMRKNDGRWTWIRLKSNYFYETRQLPLQGVCDTKEEAMKMALADIPEARDSSTMTYEELPDVIKSVIPKSKFASARRVSGTHIVVRCNYNDEVDLWVHRGGRWTYHNPPKKQ